MIGGVALALLPLSASGLCGAVLALGALAHAWRSGDPGRPDRLACLAAIALVALWSAIGAVLVPDHAAALLALAARNLALIWVIHRLFVADGRAARLKPVRPVMAALVLVQLSVLLLLALAAGAGTVSADGAGRGAGALIDRAVFNARMMIDLLVAIGALLLLHNLYAGAAADTRAALRWVVAALAAIFGYDLNLAATAYLAGEDPAILRGVQGAFAGLLTVLIALGLSRAGPRRQFSPSRAVTFQTVSLLLIAAYLVLMALVTRVLALIGGDVAEAGQALFLAVSVLAAAIWLPSPALRARLRVTLTKHLFQHRYDYREEWLRFTRTIGHGSSGGASLRERAIKALADITESPAGLLLMPNEEAQLELAARWNWSTLEVPAAACEFALSGVLETHQMVIALDEVRAGIDRHGEAEEVPAWLREAQDAWALVPLVHFDRLVGVIVLARPLSERRLDWEDFDLLKVVGQQLASYLSEQAGQQALMDASQFDEFNRRMAFVMHDIKNLASQLSLLTANAQKHADNPEFRADMLVTLRAASDKLTNLLSRLGRYGSGQVGSLTEVDLLALAEALVARFRLVHPVMLTRADPVVVRADGEALEQALVHLVQNAIDASAAGMPVYLDVSAAGMLGRVEVIDAGQGMSAEFVRSGLFKPFVSSKPGGFGIGAFEARDLVRAMGGRIEVESREGLGSRFALFLPLAETARLLGPQPLPQPAHRETR